MKEWNVRSSFIRIVKGEMGSTARENEGNEDGRARENVFRGI